MNIDPNKFILVNSGTIIELNAHEYRYKGWVETTFLKVFIQKCKTGNLLILEEVFKDTSGTAGKPPHQTLYWESYRKYTSPMLKSEKDEIIKRSNSIIKEGNLNICDALLIELSNLHTKTNTGDIGGTEKGWEKQWKEHSLKKLIHNSCPHLKHFDFGKLLWKLRFETEQPNLNRDIDIKLLFLSLIGDFYFLTNNKMIIKILKDFNEEKRIISRHYAHTILGL